MRNVTWSWGCLNPQSVKAERKPQRPILGGCQQVRNPVSSATLGHFVSMLCVDSVVPSGASLYGELFLKAALRARMVPECSPSPHATKDYLLVRRGAWPAFKQIRFMIPRLTAKHELRLVMSSGFRVTTQQPGDLDIMSLRIVVRRSPENPGTFSFRWILSLNAWMLDGRACATSAI